MDLSQNGTLLAKGPSECWVKAMSILIVSWWRVELAQFIVVEDATLGSDCIKILRLRPQCFTRRSDPMGKIVLFGKVLGGVLVVNRVCSLGNVGLDLTVSVVMQPSRSTHLQKTSSSAKVKASYKFPVSRFSYPAMGQATLICMHSGDHLHELSPRSSHAPS
jgi:hypothetical protein